MSSRRIPATHSVPTGVPYHRVSLRFSNLDFFCGLPSRGGDAAADICTYTASALNYAQATLESNSNAAQARRHVSPEV